MRSRRACLQLVAALPVVLSAACGEGEGAAASTSALVAADGTVDVIVVGAGMAGLRAAEVLRGARKRVVVLEASQRVGGRVMTDRDSMGVPVEIGASWVHDSKNNPIMARAKLAQVRTLASDYSEQVWREGSIVTARASADADATFTRHLTRAERAARADESLRDALERTTGALGARAREELEWKLAVDIEYAYGADAEELSAARLDDGADLEEDNVIVLGYDGIPRAMAAGLVIRLGESVTRVEQGEGVVRVHATSGVFVARNVIVTLPVGVLRAGKVEFSPPLSEEKLAAIARVGMGVLSKTFLRFPRVFWPSATDFLGRVPPLAERGKWSQWLNVARFADAPVLAALNGGTHARSIERAAGEDIARDAMAALRTIFPQAPDPVAIAQTRWSVDPLALGSYSFLAAGALETDRRTLAAPERLVSFAGEACSEDHAQTVHGAYLSGEATAKALLRSPSSMR